MKSSHFSSWLSSLSVPANISWNAWFVKTARPSILKKLMPIWLFPKIERKSRSLDCKASLARLRSVMSDAVTTAPLMVPSSRMGKEEYSTFLHWVRRTVCPVMMHQLMHVPPKNLIARVTNHFAGGFVDERAVSIEVEAIDSLAGGVKQKLHLFGNADSLCLRKSAVRNVFVQCNDEFGLSCGVPNHFAFAVRND